MAGHYFTEVFTFDKGFHVGPAAYLILLFGCYLVYFFLFGPVSWIVGYLIPALMIESLSIDEDIDLYQNCLNFNDKKYTYMEEFNLRRYGI